ncbi:MAG: DinB family protein [Acidobacteria bacterium]|nr:DinB family protein [Acidobacteriota bacterium]MBI3471594.1 DinB family protein [Candidatus Solibacter usitatus]
MYLTLILGLIAAALLPAADAHMSREEREKAIRWLNESRTEFLQLVQDLSDEQWKWKPAPERWSVGEVAEHILLSEGALFGRVREALANPPNPDWEKKTAGKAEFLEKVMPSRVRRAQAPEEIQPRGNLTRAEIMSRYAEVREKSLRFIEETQASLKDHTVEHPFPVFNTLNAYQWFIYIPLHNMRHDKQIEEVKATPGFPK